MSKQLISQYYAEVEKTKQYAGTANESTIRWAFHHLLNEYCKPKHFRVELEVPADGTKGRTVTPDGTLKDALRLDWGYWESKDESDDLDVEIKKKFAKGYPSSNILFEDSVTAVLIQGGREEMRVAMNDPDKLDAIITAFINFERPEVRDFRTAIEAFKEDIPKVLQTLREMIEGELKANHIFQRAFKAFLALTKESINPEITKEDIREMLIQHILTEEIFVSIFNESQFHRENNVARELVRMEETFFTGKTKRQVLSTLDRYYNVIKAKAASIYDHHEKQKFLKVVYENFYKAYNPKGADRLGIVYTPNEIVRFMIESADYLVHKHFGRFLADKNVEILDPAAGTGTYITELIEYMGKDKLPYKYANEIHCNEVAILPYYIANLNIEFTYKQKMEQYEEFKNICFVDTLDNLGFSYKGKQEGMDFGFGAENSDRIRRQNRKKISVIIGNPPYNANQKNENENNKNREYPKIDKRIKETYILHSTAQKTKLYDMYSRFFRWASDRVADNGIIALVTNSSFVNARTFDGFRKVVADEFSDIYVVDLGGNVRENPKLSGPKNNVFGIQTPVAISFLVKRKRTKDEPCKIFYAQRDEYETAEDKLAFLASAKFKDLSFDHVKPDAQNNWINLASNDFDALFLLASKETKQTKRKIEERALFKLFSNGIKSNRDEWVYDFDEEQLIKKIRYFIRVYNDDVKTLFRTKHSRPIGEYLNYSIKWSRDLKNKLMSGNVVRFKRNLLTNSLYRPFTKKQFYSEFVINDVLTANHYEMFGDALRLANPIICFSDPRSNKPFHLLASNGISDYHFLGDTQCLPLYRYSTDGTRRDNITDWALGQFKKKYESLPVARSNVAGLLKNRTRKALVSGKVKPAKQIEKEDIFHYVYGVLHNPAYRKKYELNLKREFPRIPFYDDFWKWAGWGKKLMEMHINYERAKLYPLKRKESGEKAEKAKLRADKEIGAILIDDATTLLGVPVEAWEYKLGNRSALEWVLDQYKESKPSDPTIAERFDTYRFADYKEDVIELLKKVCTVSVETMKIIRAMEE